MPKCGLCGSEAVDITLKDLSPEEAVRFRQDMDKQIVLGERGQLIAVRNCFIGSNLMQVCKNRQDKDIPGSIAYMTNEDGVWNINITKEMLN